MHSRLVEVCPYCGQAWLNDGAVRHVEEAERAHEREVQAAVEAQATRLAKQLASKELARQEKERGQLEKRRGTPCVQTRPTRL